MAPFVLKELGLLTLTEDVEQKSSDHDAVLRRHWGEFGEGKVASRLRAAH